MLGIKVNKESAEVLKKCLKKQGLLDRRYKVFGRDSFIYFPISHEINKRELKFLQRKAAFTMVRVGFGGRKVREGYRDTLRRLTGSSYEEITKGFETVGRIAIIDAKPALARKIAYAVMKSNKSIKTVLRKAGAVRGRYRIRSFRYVAGKRNYVAEHKENGSTFEFDVRKAFFSPRLAFERGRISRLVKDGEHVVVMFAGVGPFAIEIAKRNRRSEVVAIELNRMAYNYMLSNIKRNGISNVIPELGDVKKIAGRYRNYADRIVMPLPKDAHHFLDSAAGVAKRRCIVHYYIFAEAGNGYGKVVEHVKSLVERKGRSFRLLGVRTVRPYSPSIVEIVIDFEMRKS